MKSSFLTSVAGALVAAAGVHAGCQNIAGNYYCNQVNAVSYNQVGSSGSYKQITAMNDDGTCSSQDKEYSGNLAPFDEGLSVHFRGPIALKQFAVYYKGDSGDNAEIYKREAEPEEDVKINIGSNRYGGHKHKRVYVTDTVYVTSTVHAGEVPPAPATTSSSAAPTSAVPTSGVNNNLQANAKVNEQSSAPASSAPASSPAGSSAASSSSSSSSSAASSSSSSSSSSGDWSRKSYYNAESGTGDNLVFMNNMGGAGSGVFDNNFGNSISYAGSDGTSCASKATVLDDVTVGSNKEFMIFSGDECGDDDCGYYRPGIPAYKGFAGATKMFLFEFSMPSDDSTGFNADMPAIWFLNAQIPRTLQYGKEECSCWSSGCGELDVFEVLNSGNDYLTSHIHSSQGASSSGNGGGGGTSDYFERPTSGTLRAAVVFDGDSSTVSISKVDGTGSFSDSYSDSDVSGWSSTQSSKANINLST
uniref:glucan endo-1,3-beta-D-glucosidase n=1 Tax=Blastobotrys adeninivorans TaxID=409370 RepID=A0A060TBZ8_BLAAD